MQFTENSFRDDSEPNLQTRFPLMMSWLVKGIIQAITHTLPVRLLSIPSRKIYQILDTNSNDLRIAHDRKSWDDTVIENDIYEARRRSGKEFKIVEGT